MHSLVKNSTSCHTDCVNLNKIISVLCFQLAGVVAVEVTGGPTIDFVPGRRVCCAIPLVRILVVMISLNLVIHVIFYLM